MTKHFAAVFVAASTLLAATSHGALARTRHHVVRATTHTVRAHHHIVRAAHFVRTAAVHAVGAGDTSAWVGETGKASYYGPAYNGHRSASGERFDQMALTAAHPWLPFGTKVRVLLAGSDRSVIVTITDRLYSGHRVVDLSVAAARQLGIISRGVAQVSLLPV
jgi:rare lipoprotein A